MSVVDKSLFDQCGAVALDYAPVEDETTECRSAQVENANQIQSMVQTKQNCRVCGSLQNIKPTFLLCVKISN